ncbi:MAG: DUF4252 domain-containing protein [Bryobacteraceae bacterium]
MKNIFLVACLAAASSPAFGQDLKLDHLDRLSAKATDTVNVTLDGSLLRMASRFLSDDSDEVEIKKLVGGLKAIMVRSFEFKNSGEYLESDVEAIRSQLRDPAWKKIIEVRSKVDGNADIYLRTEGDHVVGATLISAEPKELTIVHIDGTVDLEGLRKIAGNFGVPSSMRKKMEGKGK